MRIDGDQMVQITLYAQPMGSEPYLNLSTFGVADEAAAEQSQNIKGLTDIGRQVCETAQTMDEEASISGTSMDGSSYEWGLRIEMKNLNVDMLCKTNSKKPMTVKDHIIKLEINGEMENVESFIRTLVSDLARNPFEVINWDNLLKSENTTKEKVVSDWEMILGIQEQESAQPLPASPEDESDEPTPTAPTPVATPVSRNATPDGKLEDYSKPETEPESEPIPTPTPVAVAPRSKRRVKMKLKKNHDATTRPCPKCKEIVHIDPTQDPIVFKCPNCGLKGKFKRKKKPVSRVAKEVPEPKMAEEVPEPKMAEEVPEPKMAEEVPEPEKEPEEEPEPEPEPEEKPEPEPEPEEEPEPEKEPEEEPEPEPEPEEEPEPEPEPEEEPEPESEPEEVPEPEKEPEEEPEPEKEPEPEPEPIKEPEEMTPEAKLEEYFEKAERFKNRNQYHDAVRYYDMILDLEPENSQALNNKGIILWANKKYKLAIELFDQVLELDKTNAEALINKAASLNRLGEKDAALKLYDELLEYDNTNTDAWSNKGVILFSRLKYEEASECFANAVKNNPNDEDSWFNLGYVLEKLGQYDNAVKAYEKVLKLNPGNNEDIRAYHDCLKRVRQEVLKDWS